ncbi:MAG: N-acetyltransferase family protein [Acidimicrobiales bacterium]|jgi:L-amino acid N-acyltransferase YncA
MTHDVTVRDAEENDLEAIVSIYNQVVATTSAMWREQPTSMAERRAWLSETRTKGLPVLVATDTSGVLGFASCAPFRDWPGYARTVEHSIHVHADARGRGIGARLLSALEVQARGLRVHVMVAGIDATNEGSMRFHQRAGFVEVARMPEVGRHRGQWRDLVLLQKILVG